MNNNILGRETTNFEDLFHIGDTLGHGRYKSRTYICTEIDTGIKYACKSIPKTENNNVDEVRTEIRIMQHLAHRHNNIATIKGVYEDVLRVRIVMELCSGGELFYYPFKMRHYSERNVAGIARIVVGVVEACHSNGVILKDLKLESFLLVSKDDDLDLRLVDFGLAAFFEPGQVFTEVVGSPHYVAPEVLFEHYGPEVDIWNAGVILYILLTGAPPFQGETQVEIFDAISRGYVDFESDPWPLISDSAKQLIRNMLCSRPSERFTARKVLFHPWIYGYGVAPDTALPPGVLSRLKHFSAMMKHDKIASCQVQTDNIDSKARVIDESQHQESRDHFIPEEHQNYGKEGYERPEFDRINRLVYENELRGVNKTFSSETDASRALLRSSASENEALRRVVKSLTSENEAMRALLKSSASENEALRVAVKSLTSENDASRALVDSLTSENETLRVAVKNSNSENDALKCQNKESVKSTERENTRTLFELGTMSWGSYPFALKDLRFMRESNKESHKK